MKPTIYVIVAVTYEYWRFQDNLGASTDLEEARKIARQEAEKEGHSVIEGPTASELLNQSETPHIWIQEFS